MHKLAIYLTDYLIIYNVAEENKKEEYIYGLKVMLAKFVNYISLIILALLNHNLFPGLVFMICFFSLRGRTGGYHAATSFRCYLGSITIFIFISKILIPVLGSWLWIYVLIMLFSLSVIVALAPVNHPNLCLSKREMEVCRRGSRKLVCFLSISIFVAILLNFKTIYIAYAVLGVGTNAVLLLIAKLMGQEVKGK